LQKSPIKETTFCKKEPTNGINHKIPGNILWIRFVIDLTIRLTYARKKHGAAGDLGSCALESYDIVQPVAF